LPYSFKSDIGMYEQASDALVSTLTIGVRGPVTCSG
jgi:hypothetical protein